MDIVTFQRQFLLICLYILEYHDIHVWILQELLKKNSVFSNILTSTHCSSFVYIENCRFLRVVLKQAIYTKHAAVQEQLNSKENIYEKLFEIVVRLLEDKAKGRELGTYVGYILLEIVVNSDDFADKLRALLSLLRIIASSQRISVDEESASYMTNKLLKLIATIKSLAQAGSNLNKNCLMTIGSLVNGVREVILMLFYIFVW